MNFFQRSIALLKLCLTFFKKNKDLLIFPLISAISCCLFLAGLAFSWFHYSGIHINNFDPKQLQNASNPFIWDNILAAIGLYIVLPFIGLFFNASLIACATQRLQGNKASLSQGCKIASQHLPQLLGWSLISSTIGVIIHMLERSHSIVAFFIGLSWALCTFFVVPIMIIENKSPWQALKGSKNMFQKKWRRVTTFSFIFFLFMAAIATLIYFAFKLAFAVIPEAYLLDAYMIGVPTAIVLYIIFAITNKTLNEIARSILYLYKKNTLDSAYCNAQVLDAAFIPTRKYLKSQKK